MSRQRKRKGLPIHGWLNFYKPRDMTSTQAVAFVKRLYNAEKAGHAGTLDPLAEGVLPIALGEATKTVPFAMESEKEYRFTIQWGASTASQDAEGEIIARSDVRPPRAAIEAALPAFLGAIRQVPPKFSAVKIGGERAYDLAREGEEFEIEARDAFVHAIGLVDCPDTDHAVIHVRSAKGFYVRALARDLALMLGAEGHIVDLRRTRTGPFLGAAAHHKDALEAMREDADGLLSVLQPLQAVLADVPVLKISPAHAGDLRMGRTIVLLPHVMDAWRARLNAEDRTALAECAGEAVALGDVRAGRFEPARVFQMG